MAALRVGLVALFMLALPIWLITSNLRVAVSRTALYEYEFAKNNTALATGMGQADLLRVAQGFVTYFNSTEEPMNPGSESRMNLEVVVDGARRLLFNDKEVEHLKDVKGMIQFLYRVQVMALAYILGYFAVSYAARGKSGLPDVGGLLVISSAATVALLGLAGAGVTLGFDALFLQFHLLSFSNNLWQLDPTTDYLIRVFPREFFFDASLFIAGATMVEAAVTGIGAQAWRSFARKRTGTLDNA